MSNLLSSKEYVSMTNMKIILCISIHGIKSNSMLDSYGLNTFSSPQSAISASWQTCGAKMLGAKFFFKKKTQALEHGTCLPPKPTSHSFKFRNLPKDTPFLFIYLNWHSKVWTTSSFILVSHISYASVSDASKNMKSHLYLFLSESTFYSSFLIFLYEISKPYLNNNPFSDSKD